MYNFGIPSTLKSWVDHIARAGVTFRYTANGLEGLVKNKKVYLAVSTGAIYTEGYAKAADFTEPYLNAILNFLGITDITAFRVEGVLPCGTHRITLIFVAFWCIIWCFNANKNHAKF